MSPHDRIIRPEEALLAAGMILLITLHLAYGISIRRGSETIQHYLIGIIVLCAFAAAVNWKVLHAVFNRPRTFIGMYIRAIRDWFPFLGIVVVYENIIGLATVVIPETADGYLRNADRAIFGTDPTLWVQRLETPALTDYMTVAYLLYFALPISILAILYAKDRQYFRKFSMAIVCSYAITFIGYILVPAEGPVRFMPGEYTAPLSGILYDPVSNGWDTMRSMTRDCFPSHHTVIGALSVYYVMRIRDRGWRPFVVAVIILGTSLILSAFYLRYHWAVDIFAGLAVAGISIFVGNNADRWWRGMVLRLPRPLGAGQRSSD